MKNERHGFDPYSLVFGLFFASVGIAFTFGDVDTLGIDPLAVGAVAFLLLGALLLAYVWSRRTPEDPEA